MAIVKNVAASDWRKINSPMTISLMKQGTMYPWTPSKKQGSKRKKARRK